MRREATPRSRARTALREEQQAEAAGARHGDGRAQDVRRRTETTQGSRRRQAIVRQEGSPRPAKGLQVWPGGKGEEGGRRRRRPGAGLRSGPEAHQNA